MSDTMTGSNRSRYEAITTKLAASAYKPDTALQKKISRIGVARLASLMTTDKGKSIGDQAAENISGLIEGINDELNLTAGNGHTSDTQTLLANQAIHELMALNNQKTIGHSNATNAAIKVLLVGASENAGTLGRISLLRNTDLFDKKSTEAMPTLVDFIKGENGDVSDSKLAEFAVIANRSLDLAKKTQDSGLIQGSFTNLVNHKVFEELPHRMEVNAPLAAVMFGVAGKAFASDLYEHCIKDNNDSYAMDLLSHSNHGLLRDSKNNVINDPQVKSLLQIAVKSSNAERNIERLVGIAETPKQLDIMLESLSDVHNNHYSSQNLSVMLDKVGATMSADQLKRFGEIMVKNYQYQPVMPALKKILDIGREKGYEFNHLERASSQIRQELNTEFQKITRPMTAYSTTTIDFPAANTSIALRDCKSVPHLQSMIDGSVGDDAGEFYFEVTGSDSLLDQITKNAIDDYMVNADATKLNELMSKPIRAAEKDSKKWAQLLFEANKQDKSLPPLSLDDINILSDVANKDAAIYSGSQHLIDLSDLHTTDDIIEKLNTHDSKSLTIDETGLGKEYDKNLLSALKGCADDPKNKQKQSILNDLIGLPVTELSSKIEKQQENRQSDGNFIKKVTDTLLITSRSPKQVSRRPK